MSDQPNGEGLEGVLATITWGKVKRPIFALLYGLDGVGKTTFASKAPIPIFVGTEAGTFQMDVNRFPKAESFTEFCSQIDGLISLKHPYKTIVVDTLDWLEPLIWQQVCAEGGVESIENYQGGFGKGYIRAAELWRSHVLSRFEILAAKYHVLLIGHAQVKAFNDPNQAAAYDRYILKINERAAALVREAVDAVLFATVRTETIRAKTTKKEVRAVSDGTRVVYTEGRPAFDAKNRFQLPFEMPLEWGPFGQSVLASYSNNDPKPLEKHE